MHRRSPWTCGTLAVGLLALVAPARAQAPAKPPTPPGAAAPAPAPKAPPPPVTRLEVTVTDPAGRPVAGAFVMAVPEQGAYRPGGDLAAEKVRTALTGPEGGARLESLPRGPWTVTVRARGFVTKPLRGVASGPLAVRLEKGGAIAGVVREAEGNRPVAGARVSVEGGVPLPAAWSEDAARNETATDAMGRFRLEGIGREPVTLAARAPGFGRTERADVRAGASVEIFLFPGASIGGAVRDDAGRPVAGAWVRAEGDKPWGAPRPERSDARGEFRLSGVPPGEYTVVAREGARAPGVATVVVEPQAEATTSLLLSDGGYATGRIVDASGRPLAGRARVEALGERGLPAFASDLLAAEATTDGTFALGPLPLGSLGIGVSAPGHASRRVEAEVPARGRTVDLGDVALEPGLSIRGRVRDREGNGVAGATVAARLSDSGAPSEGEAVAETDGRFLVGGLGPGRHSVSAAAAGFATAWAAAIPGGEPVDLMLAPGGEIAGRVVDADGSPVDGARVSAQEERRPRGGGGGYAGGQAEEGEGRFLLRDVAAGTYTLEVQAGSRGEASMGGVRVAAGRATDVGTIALARGGVVTGVVVDAEGAGIPGATVGAERDANRRTGRLRTQSGSTGAFELRGVPLGAVYVSATHPAYAPGPEVATTVDPEKEAVPVRLVLVRGGRIEGRALYRDGRAFGGGRVSHYSVEPRGAGMRWETAAIAPDGSFVLDHVPAGRTMVMLMAFTPATPMVMGGGGNTLTSVASREVDVREGETTPVDLSLRDVVVAGRVTRGGQPEPGVLVSVMGGGPGTAVMTWVGPTAAGAAAPGLPALSATTRDDGRYELVVFSPGPSRVEMRGPGQGYPGRQVDVPDADRFELDLEVGAATVSGIVVDREGGTPVPEASVSLQRSDESSEWRGGAESGPDGRFSIAAEPGEYGLTARARDRKPTSQALSVGPSGVADLRVELERGLEIRGRLVDSAGRPASGLLVLVTPADGKGSGHADSGADGGFRIGGLEGNPHAVVGGSELAGFAFRSGITPGGAPLALALRPAGRIAVRVVDTAGQPLKDAYPRVEAIDGARVRMPGRTSGPTDASGRCDLVAPPGSVDVVATGEKGEGRGRASVAPGETTSLTLVLQPRPPKKP